MRGKRVKDVSCGEQHTACVDGEGHVYTWGFGGSFFKGASPLSRASEHVDSIPRGMAAPGRREDGPANAKACLRACLLASGCGGLGHGDKKTRLYPTLVDELAEEQRSIVQVSCGSMHTVALDSEGFVWTWGKGEYGRLGLGSSSDSTGPELVELLADLESVVQVAASGSFTLALTSNGQVYGWGKNDRACRPRSWVLCGSAARALTSSTYFVPQLRNCRVAARHWRRPGRHVFTGDLPPPH